MKKIIIVALTLLFAASVSFAADFIPTLLKISAPAQITYDFDNKTLEIPVTVSGVPATAVFLVFTKDQADKIGEVTNGYNGWHYVNKIDTCLYASQAKLLDVGKNVMTWDGKDSEGGVVPAGEYRYYIWAFDSVSPKKKATQHVSYGWNERGIILDKDEKGNPLNRPIIYNNKLQTKAGTDAETRLNYKWIIGGDPEDATLVETTAVQAVSYGSSIAIHPTNHTFFFDQMYDNSQISWIRKYKWVPNGAAEIQTAWGEDGKVPIPTSYAAGRWGFAGVTSDGGDMLFTGDVDIYTGSVNNNLYYIDRDTGAIVRKVDINNKWLYDWRGEWANEGPCDFSYVDGRLYMSCFFAYLYTAAEPDREGDNIFIWVNGNGDGQGDNFWDLSEPFPFNYRGQMDRNWFGANPSYDLGAVSFDLCAPDGTGLGFFSFAGESAAIKFGVNFLDNNTPYDGIYTDNASSETDKEGWFFVGHDSIKGIISSSPTSVEADAPAAFSVAQNTPNPFNPSTTISFTIPEAGTVGIDVFNVAGQKVDTIANEFMGAGSHSVTWDASALSAGVYFYTVKTGDFSRTMKMTLLK